MAARNTFDQQFDQVTEKVPLHAQATVGCPTLARVKSREDGFRLMR